MDKSPEAFRTISEVAEALETPAHVLRFWESRFPQIRPVKRAGGRRYYRPSDVALLTGIKRLLHDEGMTIRGVQKILREQGIRHVAGLMDDTSPEEAALEQAMIARFDAEPDLAPDAVEEETAAVLAAALSPDADVSGTAPSEAEESASQATLDWLSTLPQEQPAAHPDTVATDTSVEIVAAEAAPVAAVQTADPPARPALTISHVSGGHVRSAPEAGPDDTTATFAARLRALPRGSLSARRDALRIIAQRIADLHQRLAGPPARP